jgi:hypothetical protein
VGWRQAGIGHPNHIEPVTTDPLLTCPDHSGPAVEDSVHKATARLAALRGGVARDNDEIEWQGGRVYLHLGARRDDPPRG